MRTYLEPQQEYWLHLAAVYYELQDRPGQRCHTDTLYSFTSCIEVPDLLVSSRHNVIISCHHVII